MASPTTSVMWFRRDLRLGDNPALLEACADGGVLPLFVVDASLWKPSGGPRRAYLAASLRALDESLATAGAGWSSPTATRSTASSPLPARSARSASTSPPTTARTATVATRRSSRPWPSTTSSWSAPGRRTPSRRGGCTTSRGTRTASTRPSPRPGRRTAGAARWTAPEHDDWLELSRSAQLPDTDPPVDMELPEGRRAGRAGALARLPRRQDRRLRRRPQPPRPRRHLPAVGPPQVGRDPPAHAAGRPGPEALEGRRDLPQGAGLAGVLRRRALPPARVGARLPAAGVRADGLRRPRRAAAGVEGAAAPAIPSSTPACVSCARPAGCTTGCG